jgi:DNA-directed RNA polymerase subunit E'/Rpb7
MVALPMDVERLGADALIFKPITTEVVRGLVEKLTR